MSQIIYTAADGNYALQAQVLMLSLVKTQKRPTTLLVFGNGWSDKETNRLKSLQNSLVTVEVQSVNADQFRNIKLTNKFPLATAYNVLAPEFLIQQSGRALYVDADVVIMEDLEGLFTRQLQHCVAAVLDAHIGWVSSPSMWRPWREEGMDPMTPYLNTGVMLIDLDRWRELDITKRIVGMLAKYALPCVDQDAINIVLRGDFDQLEPSYNLMPYHLLEKFRYIDAVEDYRKIGDAITDPVIVHFHRSFFGKPWTYFSTHPGTKMWRSLASEINPRWRKRLDAMSVARARAATYAKMTVVDNRSLEYHLAEDNGRNHVRSI